MKYLVCSVSLSVLVSLASLGSGCKSAAEKAVPSVTVQTAPGTGQAMSPEAAKAADAAAHREKRGY